MDTESSPPVPTYPAYKGEHYSGIEMIAMDTNRVLVTFFGSIETPVKASLQAGKRYCADFFSRCTEESSFCTNGGLSLYFTVDTPSLVRPAGLPYEFAEKYTPSIKTAYERKLDTFWAPVSGSFIASGGERFMSIAPAYRLNELAIDTLPVHYQYYDGSWGSQAYYIGIDEVFVYDCNCQRHFVRDTVLAYGETLHLRSRYRTRNCSWENGNTDCMRSITESGEYILTAYLIDYDYVRIDTIQVRFTGDIGIRESPYDTESPVFVYPNPAYEKLTIKSDSERKIFIEIYDMAGRQVLNHNIEIPAELSIKHLKPGTYVYKILNPEKILLKTEKITIIH